MMFVFPGCSNAWLSVHIPGADNQHTTAKQTGDLDQLAAQAGHAPAQASAAQWSATTSTGGQAAAKAPSTRWLQLLTSCAVPAW